MRPTAHPRGHRPAAAARRAAALPREMRWPEVVLGRSPRPWLWRWRASAHAAACVATCAARAVGSSCSRTAALPPHSRCCRSRCCCYAGASSRRPGQLASHVVAPAAASVYDLPNMIRWTVATAAVAAAGAVALAAATSAPDPRRGSGGGCCFPTPRMRHVPAAAAAQPLVYSSRHLGGNRCRHLLRGAHQPYRHA